MARRIPGMTKRGNVWYGRAYDGLGRRKNHKLSENYEAAKSIFLEIKRKYDLERNGLKGHAGQHQMLEALAEEYLAFKESSGETAHTRDTRTGITVFLQNTDCRLVADLDPIKAHKAAIRITKTRDRRKVNRSNRTANKYVSAMCAALNWAARNSKIVRNPIEGWEKLNEKGKNRKRNHARLTVDQASTLVEAFRAYDQKRPKQIPQWIFPAIILDTGMRQWEAAQVEWRDLQKNGDVWGIRVREEITKTQQERFCEFGGYVTHADLLELKMSQARVTRRKPKPGDRILLSPLGTNWTRGKNLRNSARHMEKMVEGVDELAALVAEGQTVGFHALRHTFCTQCFQAEIPIDQVCLMMGHADIKTTWAIYTDWQKLNTKGGSAKLNEFRANARRGG